MATGNDYQVQAGLCMYPHRAATARHGCRCLCRCPCWRRTAGTAAGMPTRRSPPHESSASACAAWHGMTACPCGCAAWAVAPSGVWSRAWAVARGPCVRCPVYRRAPSRIDRIRGSEFGSERSAGPYGSGPRLYGCRIPMAMRARPAHIIASRPSTIMTFISGLRIGRIARPAREPTTVSGIVRLDYSRFNILLEYFTVKP